MSYEHSSSEPDSDSMKMFVGQINKSMSEEECRELFAEFGPVYELMILKEPETRNSRGCCFVTFFHKQDALAAQNALHMKRTLPGMHNPIQMKPADQEIIKHERTVFVGMIGKDTKEAELEDIFSPYGVVEELKILRETNGDSKGCAFVTYATKRCANKAVEVLHHSKTMEGSKMPIVVKFADKPKDKDAKKSPYLSNSFEMKHVSGFNSPPQGMGLFDAMSGFQSNNLNNRFTSNNGSMYGNTSNNHGPGMDQILAAAKTAAACQNFSGSSFRSNPERMDTSFMQGLQNLAGDNNSLMNNGMNRFDNHSNMFSNSISSNPFSNLRDTDNLNSQETLAKAFMGLQHYASLFLNALSAQNSNGNGNNHFSNDRNMSLDSAAGKDTEGPDGANLFVHYLPQEVRDYDLLQMFSSFGCVVSAKVNMDKVTNTSKCFGFVSFDHPDGAEAAIRAMNGFKCGNKRLKVQLKKAKDEKPYTMKIQI